jgi:hypothetical protein
MEPTDGSRTSFTIYITIDDVATPLGYLAGSTSVYLNGALQRPSIDYTESDPENGVITFFTAPASSDWVWIQCLTMAG